MKKLLIIIVSITISSNLFAQKEIINKNSYLEKIKELRKINFYNLNDIQEITSDCGAFFNKKTNTLSTENECRGKLWMENLRDLNTPYEFEMTFTPLSNYDPQKNTHLVQIFLGNSPSGFTWIGFNKSGEVLISVRNQEGWTDKLKVIKTDKINFNKENHIKFIHFPDGIFYVELNSYSRWSYDLPLASQKIPLIGLSNRISFYSDIKLSQLDLNLYHKEDEFITKMQNLTANMQADRLLEIESDMERIKFRNSMKMLFDSPCYGNCKNGYGIYDYSNGMQYAGYWENEKYQGKGILYNDGIMYYKGSFEKGEMNGYGEVYKDGETIYKGQWKNGKPENK
ncbi:hypothetical protein MC378_13945 [Polaribacter sp. MSW13]|uniref:Uncharacterized protein n=1 Tax=Polaribacter marinus TaxID=2916838 RepID=A0A9X2AKA8_9FLAO|nr:hypothetical protein [Polaribacter marinus]MCI2230276.1 hypothetical protein [Polaribacter marinus]